MTYPGGAPGGYPGQGPQQPLQGPGYGRPPGSGPKPGPLQIATMAAAGLGVVNFFVGFANATKGVEGYSGGSYFDGGSVLPGLFLIGALFLLPAILPGDAKPGIAPAAFSVTGLLTVLFFMFSGADGVGTILLLIFGLLQAAATVFVYLNEAGILKTSHGQNPNQYGGYQQQPGGYPPGGQFGQQQPPPGQYPPPGQQTTFAPQQGQFGQPGQQPGTPPGGYPQ
jgi:hypothetical protein